MFIGILVVTLQIPQPYSIKEKRKRMNSIKQRLQNKFNASVAETGLQNSKKQGELSFVTVGTSHEFVNSVLDKALNFIDRIAPGSVESHYMEIIKF